MNTATTQVEPMLRASQVAEMLSVSVSTVYRLTDAGRLRAHLIGDGQQRRRGLRIPRSAVDDLLRETAVA